MLSQDILAACLNQAASHYSSSLTFGFESELNLNFVASQSDPLAHHIQF